MQTESILFTNICIVSHLVQNNSHAIVNGIVLPFPFMMCLMAALKTVYLQVQELAIGYISHFANYKSNIYSYKHLHKLAYTLYSFLHREVYRVNIM